MTNSSQPDPLVLHASEGYVLGALLTLPDQVAECRAELLPSGRAFADPLHQRIYDDMASQWETRGTFDAVTLTHALLQRPELASYGQDALFQQLQNLQNQCPNPYGWRIHADQVRDMAVRRHLRDSTAPTIRNAALDLTTPLSSSLGKAEASLYEVSRRVQPGREESLREQLRRYYEDPQEVRGFRTGIGRIDRLTGGFEAEDLIVVLGYSGAGKSLVLADWTRKFTEYGKVLVVPTEMSKKAWQKRMVASKLGASGDMLRRGTYRNWGEIEAALDWVESLPVEFLDAATPSGDDVLSAVHRHNPDAIVVDGLSDMGASERIQKARQEANEFAVTTDNITTLHHIRHDLHKVVLVSCQMNITSRNRDNKRPNPRDARGSPARIWQLSTRFFTLYRPYHLVETGEVLEKNVDSESIPAQLIGNKNAMEIALRKDRETSFTGAAAWVEFVRTQYNFALYEILLEDEDGG